MNTMLENSYQLPLNILKMIFDFLDFYDKKKFSRLNKFWNKHLTTCLSQQFFEFKERYDSYIPAAERFFENNHSAKNIILEAVGVRTKYTFSYLKDNSDVLILTITSEPLVAYSSGLEKYTYLFPKGIVEKFAKIQNTGTKLDSFNAYPEEENEEKNFLNRLFSLELGEQALVISMLSADDLKRLKERLTHYENHQRTVSIVFLTNTINGVLNERKQIQRVIVNGHFNFTLYPNTYSHVYFFTPNRLKRAIEIPQEDIIIPLLCAPGILSDQKYNDDDTLLHIIARSSLQSWIFQILVTRCLELGMDINCKNAKGETPVSICTNPDNKNILIKYAAVPPTAYPLNLKTEDEIKSNPPLR